MTPKEKAEELVNKYWDKLFEIQNRIENLHEQAKQCALIAVDEILDNLSIFNYKISPLIAETTRYWQQVKHEIERL